MSSLSIPLYSNKNPSSMKNPCRLCPLTLFLLIFTCSKSTVETLEKDRSSVFIVNIEHISHFFLVFLLLTLNKKILAGQRRLFQSNYSFQSTLELSFPYQNITFQFTQILYRRQPSHSIGLIGREFPFVYFFYSSLCKFGNSHCKKYRNFT